MGLFENLGKFVVDGGAAQVACHDGAVGAEEDNLRNAVDAVGVGAGILSIHDLRVWNAEFVNGFQRVLGLVPVRKKKEKDL